EGVPSAACRGSVRVRDENGGAEHALGDVIEPPEPLRGAKGRFALDYRLAVEGSGRSEFPRASRNGGPAGAGRERPALFGRQMKSVRVIDAAALGADPVRGPCLLETPFWSAVVPAGWHVAEAEFGLRLTR